MRPVQCECPTCRFCCRPWWESEWFWDFAGDHRSFDSTTMMPCRPQYTNPWFDLAGTTPASVVTWRTAPNHLHVSGFSLSWKSQHVSLFNWRNLKVQFRVQKSTHFSPISRSCLVMICWNQGTLLKISSEAFKSCWRRRWPYFIACGPALCFVVSRRRECQVHGSITFV